MHKILSQTKAPVKHHPIKKIDKFVDKILDK